MKVRIERPQRSRIEMIPLIDMIFLVLVSFTYGMLSMAVHRGLPVILPSSSTAGIEQNLILSVSIKGDGSMFLDKAEVSLEGLMEALTQQASERKETGVLLFADRNIPYQRLFEVLDRIRMAGITRISLQAEAKEAP